MTGARGVRQTPTRKRVFVRMPENKSWLMLRPMKSPETPVALPLDYAAELALELHLMRSECSQVAQGLAEQDMLDEIGLEECAVLDEALARAHRLLQGTVSRIRKFRAARS